MGRLKKERFKSVFCEIKDEIRDKNRGKGVYMSEEWEVRSNE
jgi:hypothetical protein